MAKVPARVLDRIRGRPQDFPLPLEPMHSWRSAPYEGGHTHCESCLATIHPGDSVVGCYLKYVRVVFYPVCGRQPGAVPRVAGIPAGVSRSGRTKRCRCNGYCQVFVVGDDDFIRASSSAVRAA